MMTRKASKWILSLAVIAAAQQVYAADAPSKAYTLTNLQKIVAADAGCKKIYIDLQRLTKKPIVLQYTSKDNQSAFDVKHADEEIMNHSYKIIQQNITETSVSRIGSGSFDLDNNKLDYVLQISADLKQTNYKYTYPMIISSEKMHCVYTALLVPDQQTVAAFKKNIQNGNLNNGADLTAH